MEKQDPDRKLNNFLAEEKHFLDDLKQVDVEKNWRRFRKTTFSQKSRFFMRAAAAVLFLLAVTTTLYFTANRSDHSVIQVSANPGNTELLLSDGTAISLNEGAVISYPEKLKRRKREVTLSGEAFFEVASNKRPQFFIYISDVTVRVLGTSFNIREDTNGIIEVGVVHGEVLFYKTGFESDSLKLKAGEIGIYNSTTDEFVTTTARSKNYIFWKTDTLTFEDESLSVVFAELETVFEQVIVVPDSAVLQNRWNSIHKGQQLNEILDELCLYFDLEYLKKDDTIYVQRK